uniref:Secreted protein n=1 Tax=Mesocestoides corti TaxID=53468 RepID=A0A5K3EV01_MESCO
MTAWYKATRVAYVLGHGWNYGATANDIVVPFHHPTGVARPTYSASPRFASFPGKLSCPTTAILVFPPPTRPPPRDVTFHTLTRISLQSSLIRTDARTHTHTLAVTYLTPLIEPFTTRAHACCRHHDHISVRAALLGLHTGGGRWGGAAIY